jgi:hypothetical protein
MTIKEIQKKIADHLNRVETLVQGGCKAFAEDALGLGFELASTLNEGCVTIVVVTPKVDRSGSGTENGIPVEMQIAIQCVEKPALNRESPGHITALDAAELIAHELDGDVLEFAGISQYADDRTRTITATVTCDIARRDWRKPPRKTRAPPLRSGWPPI